jgi:outer membrane protein TolC
MVGVGVPLYSFGKLSLAKRLAKSGLKSAEVLQFQEKNQLISKVRQLYYGVLLAEEVGRLVKEAYNRLDSEIKKRNVEIEEAADVEYSPIDNLKMKVFLYDLEKRLADVRQKEAMALEGLRVQMGLAPGTVFTVFSKKLRPVVAELKPFDDYVAVAMTSRPDVKLLSVGLDAKRNQYLLEKRKLLPDVGAGLFFELGRTASDVRGIIATDDFNDPFNFTRAGVGLQISGKFDFHGANARIKKSRSEYYKLNLEQMLAKEAMKLDVKDAFLRAKTAQANLKRAREAEKVARQILFLTQSNYGIGIGDSKDLVDALQMILTTRGRYFESVFDYNSALAVLDEKIGVLPEVAK